MDERVTELEITMMHLQRMVQELNEVVYRQQQDLDRLDDDVKLLKEQLMAGGDEAKRSLEEETPPPHY